MMANVLPIYVISMADSSERRAGITRQLEALGLSFEFFDAIRGSALSAEAKARLRGPLETTLSLIDRDMSDNEIGCALSHLGVCERIVAAGHDMALVMEDDAQLLPGFAEVVQAVCALDYELIILGYPKLAPEDIRNVWLYDPIYTEGHLSSGHSYGARPHQSCMGMVGYCISRRGAQAILACNRPLVTVADDHRYFARFMRVWHLRPFVVAEDTGHVSTIRGDYRKNRYGLSARQRFSRTLRGLARHFRILVWQLSHLFSNRSVS